MSLETRPATWGVNEALICMGGKSYKGPTFAEDELTSDTFRFLPLLSSALRRYFWPDRKRGGMIPSSLWKRALLSAAFCSGICIALSLAAILTEQIAFSQVDRSNRLGLSQDLFYAMSGWTFLLYDLVHIYVIGVFASWLVRSLCWEAWIGGAAMIIASLSDFGSLSVNMFLQTPTLSAMANGESFGLSTPEAGYDVICSTLDFSQASFALVGLIFLAGAAMKKQGTARLVGWFIIAGLPIAIFQIAEVGLYTPWTRIVDDWITPISEIVQHLIMAICLWELSRRQLPSSQSKNEAKERKDSAWLWLSRFLSFAFLSKSGKAGH
jgi:hypothetical protein